VLVIFAQLCVCDTCGSARGLNQACVPSKPREPIRPHASKYSKQIIHTNLLLWSVLYTSILGCCTIKDRQELSCEPHVVHGCVIPRRT
jgi:hypothetical protein